MWEIIFQFKGNTIYQDRSSNKPSILDITQYMCRVGRLGIDWDSFSVHFLDD